MQFSTLLSSSGGIIFFKKSILDTKLFLINFIGYRCPIFHIIGNARGVDDLQIRGAGGVPTFMEKHPCDWII